MFGIQRYFAIATAVALVVTMVVVGMFFRTSAIGDLVDLTGESNIALASTISTLLLPEYPGLVAEPDGEPSGSPLPSDHTLSLNAVFSDLAEGARLLKIKFYLPDGRTIYSSDNDEIDSDRLLEPHSEAFEAAIRDKTAQCGLSFEDRLSAFSGEVFNRDVVETYYPLVAGDGAVIGVLELYTDVTMVKAAIDQRTILATLGLGVIFGFLYLILVFVVMRRVMAPVRLASIRAAAIKPQHSDLRLPVAGMPSELLPLVNATNEALERLGKALTAHRQFTADAAHELLTPLSVLKAHVETLPDPSTRTAVHQDIASIVEIVSQLLELAELDALDPGHAEAIDLRPICEEVIATLAPIVIKQKKIIELTGTRGPVPVRCCAKLLSRAVRNLIENAIAHTPEGKVVRLDLDDAGVIRVIDQGPGVAVEDRSRIFRRFWRGKGRKGPGAGLGLSIVQRFATTFGGSVEVGDAPGGGAEFILRLPLAEAPPAAGEGGGR